MKIIKVPYIDQTIKWPTGCESVSAVMLLQYMGIDISVDEFIEYLPKVAVSTDEEGRICSGDPNQVFIGSPYDPDSFGCYAPVIVDAINRVFEENSKSAGIVNDYKAIDVTDKSIEQLLTDYIDNDLPVVFWLTIDLKESIKGPFWNLLGSEDRFMWTSNEHCALLVGYDEELLYFNDPWQNHGCVGYPRSLVERRHQEMFSMAVAVERECCQVEKD